MKIQEIAEKAGVSTATVSRVVNGQALVGRAAESVGAKVLHRNPSRWSVQKDPPIVAQMRDGPQTDVLIARNVHP